MKSWEIALNKFLKQWELEKYVLAAIATGSFVVGNITNKSDMDVQTILSEILSLNSNLKRNRCNFIVEEELKWKYYLKIATQ